MTTQKMRIYEIRNVTETHLEILLDRPDGPWLTYYKGDLPREPRKGDWVTVLKPRIIGFAE